MSVSSRVGTDGDSNEPERNGGSSAHAQLARLFQLVTILQSEGFPNARELAEQCEVSRRTIYRDLDALIDAGLPVHYRAEQRGYELARGFALPAPSFTEEEAIALLILARQWKGGEGLGLAEAARSAARKVVLGLSPEMRERILTVTEPLKQGEVESEPRERAEIRKAVLEAILRQRQLRLWYRSEDSPDTECTKFCIYRLLLHGPSWYMVGRATVLRRVIVVGLPWVQKAQVTEDRGFVPPRFNLERFLARAWGVQPSRDRYDVWVRFGPTATPWLREEPPHLGERRDDLPDGGVDLKVLVDGLDEILRWLLGFGDSYEVMAPDELRQKLHEITSRMAENSAPRRSDPDDLPQPGSC